MVIISKGKTLVQGNVKELLDEEVLLVSFTVDNIEKARSLITNKFPQAFQSASENQILLHISKDEIPKYNKMFIDENIQVFGIESKRKLEDYFLKLINNWCF